jgi:hypothetical protein
MIFSNQNGNNSTDMLKLECLETQSKQINLYVNTKEDPLTGDTIRKLRGTCCNGGPQYGAAITSAETYATCVWAASVEQPVHQSTWAISAAMSLQCKGYDVGKAFAEAPAPTSSFFVKPNVQFR